MCYTRRFAHIGKHTLAAISPVNHVFVPLWHSFHGTSQEHRAKQGPCQPGPESLVPDHIVVEKRDHDVMDAHRQHRTRPSALYNSRSRMQCDPYSHTLAQRSCLYPGSTGDHTHLRAFFVLQDATRRGRENGPSCSSLCVLGMVILGRQSLGVSLVPAHLPHVSGAGRWSHLRDRTTFSVADLQAQGRRTSLASANLAAAAPGPASRSARTVTGDPHGGYPTGPGDRRVCCLRHNQKWSSTGTPQWTFSRASVHGFVYTTRASSPDTPSPTSAQAIAVRDAWLE